MSAPAPAKPPVTPPKLNPVRVAIAEATVEERTRDFREVLHAYSKPDAILEAKRCIQCRRPWCVEACPISQDCREYIRLIAIEDWDGAARVTALDNPLATSLCKVCYHYCEDACVVKKKGVPIAIRHLKRAALDYGTTDLVYVPAAPKRERVAVVGGGPAGMMAAWELGVRGYPVTVFEEEPERLGGLMQTIPAYRMTDADVEIDRARYRDLDVTWVQGRRIGTGAPPQQLLDEGYAAVFLALGTPRHRRLDVPGEDLAGVLPALPMLKANNSGQPPALGRQVLVVGGGDVAMDAVRSAKRLTHGGDVTLVYRRTRAEMPADPEEIHGAETEGIAFRFLLAPVAILGDGHVRGLQVQPMKLEAPASGGRPIPVPSGEPPIVLPADTIIVAVGQRSDLEGFGPDLDLRITSQGWPEGRAETFATAVSGIFAAGGRSVVYAMGNATRAADAIDAYLAGRRGETAAPRPNAFGSGPPFHLPAGYTTPIRS